jgi:hypothetical protein
MEYVDPSARREAGQRWEVRAVEWRAVLLAETLFGGRVVPRVLSGHPGRGFRAMLELEVPFDDLERHSAAEAAFLAAAGRDELLGGFPLVVLFAPRPRGVAVE